jgi:hypothetical protein
VNLFDPVGVYRVLGPFECVPAGVTLEDVHDVVATHGVANTQFALPLEQFEGLLRLYEHIHI